MNFKDIDQLLISKLPVNENDKYIFQRRVNKFKKDPKGFLEGSYKKRSTQVRAKLPIKYSGENNFTVISAVYNVEKYLDEYFKSLVNQSLNFKKHIQLILVDDGSADESAAIIKKWQKIYPKNIIYIYKENGGQASARNIGLEYLSTEWVTFIDPDDFIDLNYFREIDAVLSEASDINMIVTNLKFFMESNKHIKDTHPLRYRFKGKVNKFYNKDLKDNINLSAAATVFKSKKLLKNNINFDERVKPNFEDGKLIADYLRAVDYGSTAFLSDAIYFYRKREDGTSTLDNSWRKKEKFNEVLNYGFMDTLKDYQRKYGFVPKNIQMTVLYDIAWYIQYLLNKPEKLYFLSESEKTVYFKLLKDIFTYIEDDVIMDFKLAGVWFFQKVGMLGAFKDKRPPFQIAYIEKVDDIKKQVLISMFTYYDLPISFKLDSEDTLPLYSKMIVNEFNEDLFVYESKSWVPYESTSELLKVEIDGEEVRISLKGKFYNQGIRIDSILKLFTSADKYRTDGSWIFMDRETQADDNAEHLYRYMMQSYPTQKCYFVLNKSSKDWQRLEDEGFDLVDFNSIDFERKLQKSSKIISSHLEAHINNYFGDNYDFSKKFIFLQHGVTIHNLSGWFNIKNIDVFITTTHDEYNSIVRNYHRYKFTEKEVVLTGFPRHDILLEKTQKEGSEKAILIMPTWRSYLVGETIGKGSNTRNLNSNFFESNYASSWKSLLKSESLYKLVHEYGYKIIFAPHANIAPYLPNFDIPSYIEIWDVNNLNESIQELFQRVSLLVTDYSSVAFEMAVLNKPTIYYQFDRDEMYSGAHTIQKGYFSYESDGFGPIATNEKELLDELQKFVARYGVVLDPYKTRLDKTVPFKDGKNCDRVYKAIINLDQPETKKIDMNILHNSTIQALNYKVWGLVESRSMLLIEYGSLTQKKWANKVLNEALFNLNKFSELLERLELQDCSLEEYNYWTGRIAFVTERWQDAIDRLEEVSILSNELIFILLCSYAEVGNIDDFIKLEEKLHEIDLNKVQFIMLQAWKLQLYKKWQEIIDLLAIELPEFSLNDLQIYRPQILIAKSYRYLLEFNKAHQQLVDFERHTDNDIRCRLEIAKLAFSRDNYDKCINQYIFAVKGDVNLLSVGSITRYLLSYWNMDRIEELNNILPDIIKKYPDNIDFQSLYINVLLKECKWEQVLEHASTFEHQAEFTYPLVLAKYRLGMIDQAYEQCIRPKNYHSYEYWELVAELALLMNDLDLQKYCYKGIVAIFPEKNKKAYLERLSVINKSPSLFEV